MRTVPFSTERRQLVVGTKEVSHVPAHSFNIPDFFRHATIHTLAAHFAEAALAAPSSIT
jgi:hypothetical protein